MLSKTHVSSRWWFQIYLGKISHLTNIFQMGWNHQPVFNSILYLVCLFQMSDIISSHPHSQFGSVKLPGLRMVVGLPWAFIRHWSRRSRGAGVKSTRKIRVFVAKDLGSTGFFQWFLFLTLRNYGITVSPIMEVERDGFFYIRGNYIWRDTHLFTSDYGRQGSGSEWIRLAHWNPRRAFDGSTSSGTVRGRTGVLKIGEFPKCNCLL